MRLWQQCGDMRPWGDDNMTTAWQHVIMIWWHGDYQELSDNYVTTSWQQWGDVWLQGNDIVILISWFVTIMWQCGKKGWLWQWRGNYELMCDEDGVTKMVWRRWRDEDGVTKMVWRRWCDEDGVTTTIDKKLVFFKFFSLSFLLGWIFPGNDVFTPSVPIYFSQVQNWRHSPFPDLRRWQSKMEGEERKKKMETSFLRQIDRDLEVVSKKLSTTFNKFLHSVHSF
jgi:hypothetical protein